MQFIVIHRRDQSGDFAEWACLKGGLLDAVRFCRDNGITKASEVRFEAINATVH